MEAASNMWNSRPEKWINAILYLTHLLARSFHMPEKKSSPQTTIPILFLGKLTYKDPRTCTKN